MIDILLSRVDTARLYPPFLEALTELLEDALVQLHPFWVVSGYRTSAEQMALWAQGRTQPGKIVTDAKGMESPHQYGIAADLCLDGFVDRRGLQPDWREESYEILGVLAPKHGLAWGGNWLKKDRPHVQIPGYVTSGQMEPLKYCFQLGGLVNVFKYLDLGPRASTVAPPKEH